MYIYKNLQNRGPTFIKKIVTFAVLQELSRFLNKNRKKNCNILVGFCLFYIYIFSRTKYNIGLNREQFSFAVSRQGRLGGQRHQHAPAAFRFRSAFRCRRYGKFLRHHYKVQQRRPSTDVLRSQMHSHARVSRCSEALSRIPTGIC